MERNTKALKTSNTLEPEPLNRCMHECTQQAGHDRDAVLLSQAMGAVKSS